MNSLGVDNALDLVQPYIGRMSSSADAAAGGHGEHMSCWVLSQVLLLRLRLLLQKSCAGATARFAAPAMISMIFILNRACNLLYFRETTARTAVTLSGISHVIPAPVLNLIKRNIYMYMYIFFLAKIRKCLTYHPCTLTGLHTKVLKL